MRHFPALAIAGLLALPSIAEADEDERRLALSLLGSHATVSEFDTEDTTLLYGGEISYGLGLKDWLLVSGYGGYRIRTDAELADATLNNQGGMGHTLFANLQQIDLGLSARFFGEFGPFLRLRPFLSLSAGGQIVGYGSPELYIGGSRVTSQDSEWTVAPAFRGEIGFDYRLSDDFGTALLLRAEHAGNVQTLSVAAEFCWWSF